MIAPSSQSDAMSVMRTACGGQPGTPLVSIVLCTYNGARHLPALLHSLNTQTLQPTRLVLRDDRSSDDSAALVQAWARRSGLALQTVAPSAQRLGPAQAFLRALAASEPAGLHLLADQDDVWLPTKIERAWAVVSRSPALPTLYASRLRIVDASLAPIGLTAVPRRLGLASAVCESLLTGCTMALNEPLRVLAARGAPEAVAMHDWWLYLLASATGQVHFDAEPTVLYRQHETNVIGAERPGWHLLQTRWRRFATGPSGIRRNQLAAFRDLFSDQLKAADRDMVDALIESAPSLPARWLTALRVPIERQRWHDRIATRLALATGRF